MERKLKEKNESEDVLKKPKNGTKKDINIKNEVKRKIKTPSKTYNPIGRPSDFEIASPKIIECLRKGNTYECACGRAGVTYRTFNYWFNQGKSDDENGLTDTRFFHFFHQVLDAETEAEEEVVKYWRECIPGNWQAARDFLARRNPDSWGNKERVEMKQEVEVTQKAILEIPDNDNR